MALETLVMIIMIGVGCVLTIAGIIVAGNRGVALGKAVREMRVSSKDRVEVIARRVRELEPRVRELEAKQKILAERFKNLSAMLRKLNRFRDQIALLGPLLRFRR